MAKKPIDTVLFVDDEEHILSALRRATVDEEYKCLFAQGGPAALQVLEKEPVSVVVSDMKMPGMDGLHFLKIVKEKYPHTVRIVLSGFAQLQQVLVTVNQAELFKFLLKPWNQDEELLPIIRQAVSYFRMNADRDEMELSIKRQNEAYQNILKRVNQVVLAAKSNSMLFATFGSKALEVAIASIDQPSDPAIKKQQLMIASKLYKEISKVGFEEYKEVSILAICSDLADLLRANEKAEAVEFARDFEADEKMTLRQGLLNHVLVIIVNALTAFANKYYVKIKTEMSVLEEEKTLNLFIVLGMSVEDDVQALLQAYMDMMNVFVAQAFQIISGDFECKFVNGLAIIKVTTKDVSQTLQAL